MMTGLANQIEKPPTLPCRHVLTKTRMCHQNSLVTLISDENANFGKDPAKSFQRKIQKDLRTVSLAQIVIDPRPFSPSLTIEYGSRRSRVPSNRT